MSSLRVPDVKMLMSPPNSKFHPQALIPLAQSPNYISETPLAVVPVLTGIGGRRGSSSCSASDLALQTTDYQLTGGTRTLLSATATSDPTTTTTGTCCSEGRSSKPDDNKTDEHAMVLSRENSPLLPEYVFQSATGAYYRYNTEGESTMLCAEACLLIAQQNFKGVSRKDVATWLWHEFRKSVRRDEGCRVKTDLLFSLLAFISVKSNHVTSTRVHDHEQGPLVFLNMYI
jgi:hypothetical protein